MSKSVALYRKYRGKGFDDIIGQDHITTPLRNTISSGSPSHAYLFTGPRGVGKTSVARILAHEINKFDYGVGESYIDIIEIDAASNRRIDEIRDLRDKVHIAPAQADFKVYIIDEVHMLTREAFNALLKTLEEPPAHVIFILATTEVHKIPATIVSRTQRHTFRLIPDELLASHLQTIAKSEAIPISPDALKLIARHGKGSFRDSISLLDQIAHVSNDTIETEHVESMLGIATDEAIQGILDSVFAGNIQEVATKLDDIQARGTSPQIVADQLIANAQQRLIAGSQDQQSLMKLIDSLIAVHASPRPELFLLVALTRTALEQVPQSTPAVTQLPPAPTPAPEPSPPIQEQEPTPKGHSPELEQQPAIQPTEPIPKEIEPESPSLEEQPEPTAPAEEKSVTPITSSSDQISEEDWGKFLHEIKHDYRAHHATLRMAEPERDGDILRLRFRFPIHHKRLSQSNTAEEVTTLLRQYFGGNLTLETTLDKTINVASSTPSHDDTPPPSNTESASPVEQNIIDTFGGGEVVSL